MARRSVWVQMQREAERRRREAERTARALERERQRQAREAARQSAYNEKEQKRLYAKQRTQEAEQLTREIVDRVEQLEGLLSASLSIVPSVDIEALKEQPATLPFDPGELAAPIEPPIKRLPSAPSALQKLVPGAKAKYAQAVAETESRYAVELAEAVEAERSRQTALMDAEGVHSARVQAEAERVAAQNGEVEAFKTAYDARNPDAVVSYCSMVLAASQYPDGFPQQHKDAYVPESREVVIEMDLPTFEVAPDVAEYRYVKAKDEITSKARPVSHRRTLYADIVAQVTLRSVHEMLGADHGGHLESVVFNGHVDTIDPRTGQPTHP